MESDKRSNHDTNDAAVYMNMLSFNDDSASLWAHKEIPRLRAELAAAQKQRDEAIRLLNKMVEHISDNTLPNQLPKHLCEHQYRPDIGVCKFCDSWQDANILLYGEEWGSD